METADIVLPETQEEVAKIIGLSEALESLDKLPELKRQMEIFLISWTVAQEVYETVDAEHGQEKIVLKDRVFPSRLEKDFFLLFQRYVSNETRYGSEMVYLRLKTERGYVALQALFALMPMLAVCSYAFGNDAAPMLGVAFAAVLAMIGIERTSASGSEKSINSYLNLQSNGKQIRYEDIKTNKPFVGKKAPLRMISDFYNAVQELYKAELSVEAHLASPDETLRAKGVENRKKNQALAKNLARYAAAIEVKLRTGEATNDADGIAAGMARLEMLAGTSAESVERLHEMDEAMRDVEECLLAEPPMETRMRIAEDYGKAEQFADKVAVIDAEFEEEVLAAEDAVAS